MNKIFESMAIGRIVNCNYRDSDDLHSYVFCGTEDDYQCEVSENNDVYIIKLDGTLIYDILKSVDIEFGIIYLKDNIIHSDEIIFIGKM